MDIGRYPGTVERLAVKRRIVIRHHHVAIRKMSPESEEQICLPETPPQQSLLRQEEHLRVRPHGKA
jgi:hypothetical protein